MLLLSCPPSAHFLYGWRRSFQRDKINIRIMPCLAVHKVGRKDTFPMLFAIYHFRSVSVQEKAQSTNLEQACKVLTYCPSRTQTKSPGIGSVSVINKPQPSIASAKFVFRFWMGRQGNSAIDFLKSVLVLADAMSARNTSSLAIRSAFRHIIYRLKYTH